VCESKSVGESFSLLDLLQFPVPLTHSVKYNLLQVLMKKKRRDEHTHIGSQKQQKENVFDFPFFWILKYTWFDEYASMT